MANYQINSKIYAKNREVKMFENEEGGLFTRDSPDFKNVCLEAYRHYLSDAQAASSEYSNLSFTPYTSVIIHDRTWLPKSYIGKFTGKEHSVQGEKYIQISYMANKRTFKSEARSSVLCAYSEVVFLAWVKESDVSSSY